MDAMHAMASKLLAKESTLEGKIRALMPAMSGYQKFLQQSFLGHTPVLKDKVKSTQLRNQGNTAFIKDKNLEVAYALYTESAANAPADSEELAFAFANRSALLLTEGRFALCLRDISRALELPYPEKQRHKLLVRRGHALRALGRKREASEAFQCAEQHVRGCDALTEEAKEELLLDVERESQKGKREKTPVHVAHRATVPPLSHGASKEAPCASAALQINYDTKFGAHLVASRDINVGDVVLVEPWAARVVSEECRFSHCSHCLAWSRSLLPCPTCNWTVFCSSECRAAAASSYHTLECVVYSNYITLTPKSEDQRVVLKEVLSTINRDSRLHLLFRLVCIIGVQPLRSFAKNWKSSVTGLKVEEKRTRGFSTSGQFVSGSLAALGSLYSGGEHWGPGRFMEDALNALLVAKCLEAASPGVELCGAPELGLLTHLLQLCYSQNLPVMEVINADGSNTSSCIMSKRQVGLGLLATYTLLSHSCDPNSIMSESGDFAVVRATEPILTGARLTRTLPRVMPFTCMSKKQRSVILKETFNLICGCEPCRKNWPLLQDLRYLVGLKELEEAEAAHKQKLDQFFTKNPEAHFTEAGARLEMELLAKNITMWGRQGHHACRIFQLHKNTWMDKINVLRNSVRITSD